MDEETNRLLEEWGLSCLKEKFRDNMIDVHTLKFFNEEDIRQLIQPMGLMIRFREKWREWNAQEKIGLDLSNTLNSESSDTFPAGPSTENSSLIGSSEDQEEFQQVSLASEALLGLDFMLATDSDYVEKLLKSSVDGKGLLISGSLSEGLLNESQRKELGRLIIKHILHKEPYTKIQSVTFSRLAFQITKLFPKECSALYYTQSIPKSAVPSQKKRNASGILYEVYVNRRRKLRELGVIPKNLRSRSASNSTPSSTATSPNPENEEDSDQLQWLKNNIEPWGTVESHWSNTATSRLQRLSEKGSVLEYFEQYPCLKHPQGYKLLLQDFDHLYPEKSTNLINGILIYRNKIINLAKEKERNIRDRETKTNLKNLLATASDSSSPQNNLASLLLLNHILNSKSVLKKPGKEAYKPSKSEIQEGFVHFVPSESEILSVLEEKKRKYERYGLTLQPFVIVVGTLESVKKSKVVIDSTVYDLSSPVDAVDTVFKITQATNVCYQEECEQLWLCIQLAFYEISTKFDKITQTIRSVLTDLGISI